MKRIYLCIDLKTFYASVECVERHLDPFKTDLVVADPTRSKGAICLAISPKMKSRGIKNRCRIYEIPSNVHPIIAKPRMKKYIEYSAKIYGIYLKYFSKDDIHPYSIDEMFLDVTSYLNMYHKTPLELAKTILNDIYKCTKITATCGIGTNLYLAKIALDLGAKHSKNNLAYLDEKTYQAKLWHHTPITDFWQISSGTEARLKKLHLKDMYDIAHCEEAKLYKVFGLNARFLIDHSWGYEPCTIKDIKNYKAKTHSLQNSQILFKDYNYLEARTILIEMIDNLILELVKSNLTTDNIGIYIGYSKDIIKPLAISVKLDKRTASYSYILNKVLEEYDYQVNEKVPIRKVGITFYNVEEKKYEQIDLFHQVDDYKELDLEKSLIKLKEKYGNNIILRGISYTSESTQKLRNQMIGGHNAE